MRFMMNERARTCAYIEWDDDLYMSLSVHTISPISSLSLSLSLYVCIACFDVSKLGGRSNDNNNNDDDDVVA